MSDIESYVTSLVNLKKFLLISVGELRKVAGNFCYILSPDMSLEKIVGSCNSDLNR